MSKRSWSTPPQLYISGLQPGTTREELADALTAAEMKFTYIAHTKRDVSCAVVVVWWWWWWWW